MTFRFRVTAVEYEEGYGETLLIGVLESGQIGGGARIRIPTASGAFESTVVSMEGPGPEPPPFRAEKVGGARLSVGVGGYPPGRDIQVPSLAEGTT